MAQGRFTDPQGILRMAAEHCRLVSAADLTDNICRTIHCQSSSPSCPSDGCTLEEYVAATLPGMHPSCREAFSDIFSRENLLREWENGTPELSLEYLQLCLDFRYCTAQAQALFYVDENDHRIAYLFFRASDAPECAENDAAHTPETSPAASINMELLNHKSSMANLLQALMEYYLAYLLVDTSCAKIVYIKSPTHIQSIAAQFPDDSHEAFRCYKDEYVAEGYRTTLESFVSDVLRTLPPYTRRTLVYRRTDGSYIRLTVHRFAENDPKYLFSFEDASEEYAARSSHERMTVALEEALRDIDRAEPSRRAFDAEMVVDLSTMHYEEINQRDTVDFLGFPRSGNYREEFNRFCARRLDRKTARQLSLTHSLEALQEAQHSFAEGKGASRLPAVLYATAYEGDGQIVESRICFPPLQRDTAVILSRDITAEELARRNLRTAVRKAEGLDNSLRSIREQMMYVGRQLFRSLIFLDVESQICHIHRFEKNSPDSFRQIAFADLQRFLPTFLHDVPEPYRSGLQGFISMDNFNDYLKKENSSETLEYPVLTSDGSRRCIKAFIFFSTDPKPSVFAAMQDVTESREQSNVRSQLAMSQAANEAKSDFFAILSHAIRTHLNSIMGMIGMAQSCIDGHAGDGPCVKQVDSCLKSAQNVSAQLVRLVNDTLDVSRLDRGNPAYESVPFRVQDLVEDASTVILPQATLKGILLEVQTQAVRFDRLVGSRRQIEHILISLMENAVKFTDSGGKIRLVAEEYSLDEDGIVQLRLTCTDSGCGMSDKQVAQLFSPARQAQQGNGLGLTIVKSTLERMHGTIQVKSALRRGTSVTVAIPLPIDRSVEEDGSVEKLPHALPSFTGRRFLIVEDIALNAEIVQEMLAYVGAESDLAGDGQEALDIFSAQAENYYDCILMDLQMPRMNGYEAARAIRALPRGDAQSIPIIALSADAFAQDVLHSYSCGMDAHIAKPIVLKDLTAVIEKFLH